MDTKNNKERISLDHEKEYYKKKVDELSGRILRLNYDLSEQSNTIEQFKKGYQIIAKVHKIIGTTQDISEIYNEIILGLFFYLQMDRAAVLVSSGGVDEFKPAYLKGFPESTVTGTKKKIIRIPKEILKNKVSVLANIETEADEFISTIKEEFGAPYFVLTPVVVDNEITAFIYGGRMKEVRYIGYSPFDKSYSDTFESIAGFAAAWIRELKRDEMINNERLRISKDMHDEIGANLTRISLMGEIINARKNVESKEKIANQCSSVIKETIEKLDEIVWAINPLNDNLRNFIAYIVEYSEEFFGSSEIKCRYNIPQSVPEIFLSSEKRHNLFLVVKEAMNNIQKYSKADCVNFSLILNEASYLKSFKFIIKDDGKGFDINSVAVTSNGLRNMEERIAAADGRFEIKTEPGAGTEISFTINAADNNSR